MDRGQTWQSFDVPLRPASIGRPLSFHSDPKKYGYVLYQGTKCESRMPWGGGNCVDEVRLRSRRCRGTIGVQSGDQSDEWQQTNSTGGYLRQLAVLLPLVCYRARAFAHCTYPRSTPLGWTLNDSSVYF